MYTFARWVYLRIAECWSVAGQMNKYWKQQIFLLAVFEGADDIVSHSVACDVRSCASWNQEPVSEFYAIGFVSLGLSFLKSRIFLLQVLNGCLKDEKPKHSY